MTHRPKTVTRHFKFRNATVRCLTLNRALRQATEDGELARQQFLLTHRLPEWTVRFSVRHARKRVHYRVVALGPQELVDRADGPGVAA